MGTDTETKAAEECSEAFLKAYKAWVQRTREELASLPRGFKKWWAKTRELLHQSGKCCHVPALRGEDGEWVTTAEGKAQLFADTFAAKYALEEAEENEYTYLAAANVQVDNWKLPTLEEAKKHTEQLKRGKCNRT